MSTRGLILLWLMRLPVHLWANPEGDALSAFRQRVVDDPLGALDSWDNDLVNPCTWFHITCDENENVVRIDLGRYALSGSLAPELGSLSHLQYMNIYGNSITGSIPEEFGNLESLIRMDLYNNEITGPIPASLGKLSKLMFLRAQQNGITGEIPVELAGIASLRFVNLSYNNLTGVVPPFASTVKTNFEGNPYLLG